MPQKRQPLSRSPRQKENLTAEGFKEKKSSTTTEAKAPTGKKRPPLKRSPRGLSAKQFTELRNKAMDGIKAKKESTAPESSSTNHSSPGRK